MKIPDDDMLSVETVARLFGYTNVKTWRRLVVRGFYMRPLGIGRNQYYTHRDVEVMRDYSSRWGPEGELPEENHAPKPVRKGTNAGG